MIRKKILIVFGTRPEAIKMAPLIRLFKENSDHFDTRVCVTGQHREMLDQVLHFFEILPDYDLQLMKAGQRLSELSAAVLLGMQPVLADFAPDYLFVHGDTTTSTMSALAGLYAKVKIVHVEAGLRTHNLNSPFPEEANRQLTARLAEFHFAPTHSACENLIKEGIAKENIFLTGNTVIDALHYAIQKVEKSEPETVKPIKALLQEELATVLVTCHRRENVGQGFLEICAALRDLAEHYPVQLVYPVHLNPEIREVAHRELGGLSHIHLVEPLDYPTFIWLMKKAAFIITDSGGIQEEASAIGKPIVLMRDTTERPEVIRSGHVQMVGAHQEKIVKAAAAILQRQQQSTIAVADELIGGGASQQILDMIKGLHV